MPTTSVLAFLLTGLGLLFCGVRFIAANLAPLAGPAARRLFRRAVSTSWGAVMAYALAIARDTAVAVLPASGQWEIADAAPAPAPLLATGDASA